jgi:hypothetical protein
MPQKMVPWGFSNDNQALRPESHITILGRLEYARNKLGRSKYKPAERLDLTEFVQSG